MVREKYREHVGKDQLDNTEKNRINDIVYRLLENVTSEMSSQTASTSSENKEEKENLHMTVAPSKKCTTFKEKNLLTPSKGKKGRNQEDEAVQSPNTKRKWLQKKELCSSSQKAETLSESGELNVSTKNSFPQKSISPLKPCKWTTEAVGSPTRKNRMPSKAGKQTEVQVSIVDRKSFLLNRKAEETCEKSDNSSKNSPVSQTKSPGNTKSPRMNVNDVLNEVLNSDGSISGSVTEDSDSFTEEDDTEDRLVIDESENDNDDEKKWKPFSPYKPKTKNSNKKQKIIDSSDEESLSESYSEEEYSFKNKPRNRKANKRFSLCSDDSQTSLKNGQRQRLKKSNAQIKSKGRNTIQNSKTKKLQSDEDSSSRSEEDSSDNENMSRKLQKGKPTLVSSSEEDYSPKKNQKSKKEVKGTKLAKLSNHHKKAMTKSKISVLSSGENSSDSESESGIEHKKKRRKLSKSSLPKQTNHKSVKRKAVVHTSSDNDTDSNSSESELENKPKRRKLMSAEKRQKQPSRSSKRKRVMSSESNCNDNSEEDDVHKSGSDECFNGVTSTSHHKESTECSPSKGDRLSKNSNNMSSNSSSDSEEEMSLAGIRRKSQNSSKNEIDSDVSSDEKSLKVNCKKSVPEKGERLSKNSNNMSSNSSSDSEEEMSLAGIRKKSQNSSKNEIDSDVSSDEKPLKVNRKKSVPEKGKHKKSSNISSNNDSSDSEEEMSLAKLRKTSQNSSKNEIDSDVSSDEKSLKVNRKKSVPEKTKKRSPANDEESTQVKNLRKICRAAGIFINKNRELMSCKTNSQKVRRLKQILEDAGMKGRPSMKKTEKIRLKKEAAELSKENIIEQEKGRPKRKVNSLFARNAASPKQLSTPPRKAFCRLKDIVDSEESD